MTQKMTEYIKGIGLSVSAIFLNVNVQTGFGAWGCKFLRNPDISALIAFIVSILTIIWLFQKIRDSRLSIKIKRKELDDGEA